MLLPLPRARPPSADQRRRHPAHHPRCLQLHDWHGEETRLRDHWQRVYKLILAKEDVLTVSRALELALFMDAKLEANQRQVRRRRKFPHYRG